MGTDDIRLVIIETDTIDSDDDDDDDDDGKDEEEEKARFLSLINIFKVINNLLFLRLSFFSRLFIGNCIDARDYLFVTCYNNELNMIAIEDHRFASIRTSLIKYLSYIVDNTDVYISFD